MNQFFYVKRGSYVVFQILQEGLPFFFQIVLLASWNVRTDVEPGIKLRAYSQGIAVSA